MTIAYTCMLIAVVMPYIWIALAKATIRYNNHAPRVQEDKLEGWRARAHWAHLNSFEAMPGFLAGVLLAAHVGVPADTVNTLAIVFTVARVAYGLCYLKDLAALRSIVWFVGLGSVIALFVKAIQH
ncbi:MAPEG family protein [Burkholderiaceae bacterium DAT-1]|nr:MAPEG family protein [Burkholderiaceae bacterium DAT-1]